MKKIVIEEKTPGIVRFIDWLVHMIAYTLILIIVSFMFKSFYLDNSCYGLWPFLASIIIYFLNKTIKPIIFLLTLPITGLTLGIFYPFINVIILKLTGLILGHHLDLGGIFITFFVAVLISIMNFLMEKVVVEPILKKRGR